MGTATLVGCSGDQALFNVDGRGILFNTATYRTNQCDLAELSRARLWAAAPITAAASAEVWAELAGYSVPLEPTPHAALTASNRNRRHTIPKAVRMEAQLGLDRAARVGRQTQMSLYTGHLLATGGQLPYAKVQHLGRFMTAHELASRVPRNIYEKTTWSLWGGEAGRRWVTGMLNKHTLALVADGYLIESQDVDRFDDEDTIIFALTQPGDPFAVEGLVLLEDADEPQEVQAYLWDAGTWQPIPEMSQLDEWAERLVEIDGETAMNVAASLDEQPGDPVYLSTLETHELALALMASFYTDKDELRFEATLVAATPAEDYTPEERSKNASGQPRDSNGRFATVGASGTMKSGISGTIKGINPTNGYLLIESNDGKVYSIPSGDFEIGDAPAVPPIPLNPDGTPVAQPGPTVPVPPPPRLDFSKILAQPRALPNSKKAVLDRSLPTLGPAELREVLENYEQYMLKERQKNAGKFKNMLAAIEVGGVGEALNPDSSDVKPIYLAIVDKDDPQAVLDLVAMSPASATGSQATTFRRVGGQWVQDDKVLQDLKSPTPPPVVMLNEQDYQSVLEQVDQSESAIDETPAEEGEATTASAGPQYFIGANLEVWEFIAAAANAPVGNAERLRRYWSVGGKGGDKIRWNTPGDFNRCTRQLRKYIGQRVEGYCANLHHRNTGMWPGDRRNREGG